MLKPTSLETRKVMPRRGKKAEYNSGAKPWVNTPAGLETESVTFLTPRNGNVKLLTFNLKPSHARRACKAKFLTLREY